MQNRIGILRKDPLGGEFSNKFRFAPITSKAETDDGTFFEYRPIVCIDEPECNAQECPIIYYYCAGAGQ